MLYTLHYTTDLFHIFKIQWNIIKKEKKEKKEDQLASVYSGEQSLSHGL